MGLGASGKIRPQQVVSTGAASPLSIYTLGTFGAGHRSDLPNMVGFNYESTSGTIGIEYRVNRNLIVGVAGNYTTADATLTNSASVDVKAVQAAAYLSYATKAWFIDALVGYGRHDLDMARPDSGQLLRSSPDGNVLAAAVRGAYLFDLGGVRVGPIAGLTFVRSHLEGYTEAGTSQLALAVASQTVDTATASAGVRILAPFVAGGKAVVPYLNVTLEHEVGERARTLSASFAVQPQQPVFSAVPNFHAPTYGKIEGGVTLQLDDSLSATVGAASTFAREEGFDYRITAGLSYKF
jgi:outer membrane lipase/esterase